MSQDNFCSYHLDFVKDISEIKTDLSYIKDKICAHILEGEKPVTGFRDRIVILEQEVSALKKAEWTRTIVAGLIGGLVGNISPDLIQGILQLLGIK